MKVVFLAKRSKTESAESKVKSAVALGALGGGIAGPIGAGVGALTGLIIGDSKTVFPIDMMAIPAYLAGTLNPQPPFMVYIKAGETLVPTGGNVLDMTENMDVAKVTLDTGATVPRAIGKPSAYNVRYAKFFAQVKDAYKRKDGSWKKNGFKRAVREAHSLASKPKSKGGKK